MKKLFALALSLSLLGTFTPSAVRADDAAKPEKKRPKLTEEQRKLRKELLEKYDTNKDGKLDKDERAKVSKDDKEKLEKAGIGGQRKKSESGEKKDTSK